MSQARAAIWDVVKRFGEVQRPTKKDRITEIENYFINDGSYCRECRVSRTYQDMPDDKGGIECGVLDGNSDDELCLGVPIDE